MPDSGAWSDALGPAGRTAGPGGMQQRQRGVPRGCGSRADGVQRYPARSIRQDIGPIGGPIDPAGSTSRDHNAHPIAANTGSGTRAET